MTDEEKIIHDMIRDAIINGKHTPSRMMMQKAIHRAESYTSRLVLSMIAKGIIVQHGGSRNRRFSIPGLPGITSRRKPDERRTVVNHSALVMANKRHVEALMRYYEKYHP